MSELWRNWKDWKDCAAWIGLPGPFGLKLLARLRRQLIRSKPRSPSSPSSPSTSPADHGLSAPHQVFAHGAHGAHAPSIFCTFLNWIQHNSTKFYLYQMHLVGNYHVSCWTWLKLRHEPSQLRCPQAAHLKEQWKLLGSLFYESVDAYKSSVTLPWLAFGCSITLQDWLKSIWNSTRA